MCSSGSVSSPADLGVDDENITVLLWADACDCVPGLIYLFVYFVQLGKVTACVDTSAYVSKYECLELRVLLSAYGAEVNKS